MTETASFEQDALFQLNLMLWLAWSPSKKNTGIRPIFREAGFELKAIGPTFTSSPQMLARAHQSNINVNPRGGPDLLLDNNDKNLFIPIECKVSSFGPDATQAKQAAVFLSVTGSDIANQIGLPASGWDAFLFYAVKKEDQQAMLNTLQTLSLRLNTASIETVPSGTIGIAVRDDGVYLQASSQSSVPIATLRSSDVNEVCVMKLDKGEDPRPLYLIPLDPSIEMSDPIGWRVMKERIRLAFASSIGSRLDDPKFEISEDELMQAAIEIWDLWKDREALSGLLSKGVRPYYKQILDQLRKLGAIVKVDQRRILFTDVTPELAQTIRRYLTSNDFRTGEIDLRNAQMSFADLSDDWM